MKLKYFKLKSLSKIILIIVLISVLFLQNSNIFAKEQNIYNFKPFKMAFIADTHVSFGQKNSWILHNESFLIFQDTIKTLNKNENFDFIVFGGDLLENKDNELSDLPIVLDVLSELNTPFYIIPGDRDVDLSKNYTKRDFLDEFNNSFEDSEKTFWITEPVPNVVLIGLDTTITNNFSGSISQNQLLWLDNTLKNNKDKFTIITMHHPAFPVESSKESLIWKDFLLLNSSDFQQIIQKHPQVNLVISGHHHLNFTKKSKGSVFVSSPSIVTYPNSYTVIEASPKEITIKNMSINFKQIIKKAKKNLFKTEYAKNYGLLSSYELLKLQKGKYNYKYKIKN
jgi:Icc protein